MSSWVLADRCSEQDGVLAVTPAPLHLLATLCERLSDKDNSWKTVPAGIGCIMLRGRNVVKEAVGVSQCGRKVAKSKMVGRNEVESAVLGITKWPRPDSSLFKSIFTNQSQTGLLKRHSTPTGAIELNAKYDTRICTSA
jgi:hypothetical protein